MQYARLVVEAKARRAMSGVAKILLFMCPHISIVGLNSGYTRDD
jgi:hypothetical protein